MELAIDDVLLRDSQIKNMTKNERMDAALLELANGKLSQAKIAGKYGIPKSTFNDRVLGKHDGKIGNKTTLTLAEELMLVAYFVHLAKIVFGCCRSEVKSFVNNYLVESDQTHLFKNGETTDCWYYGFIHRNEDKLAYRMPYNTEAKRAEAANK